MGSYSSYLASPQWQAIRERVLARDKGLCLGCKGKATEVHHAKYDSATMSGENLDFLVSICRKCHERVTFSSPGVRRSSQEVYEATLAWILSPIKRPPLSRRARMKKRRKRRLFMARLKISERKRAQVAKYGMWKCPLSALKG